MDNGRIMGFIGIQGWIDRGFSHAGKPSTVEPGFSWFSGDFIGGHGDFVSGDISPTRNRDQTNLENWVMFRVYVSWDGVLWKYSTQLMCQKDEDTILACCFQHVSTTRGVWWGFEQRFLRLNQMENDRPHIETTRHEGGGDPGLK